MRAKTLLFGVTILLLKTANAEYDVQKYCQHVKIGTRLPSLDSCRKFYTCLGNNMMITSTCPDGAVFNKDSRSCIPQKDSNCYYDVANPCQYKKNNTFAYSSRGCNWYNYCVDGKIAGTYTCGIIGQRFYPSVGKCDYGKCDISTQSDETNMCEIMPVGEYFGDFQNCQAWYKCTPTGEESGYCDNGKVFNAPTGQCLDYEDYMCERTGNVVQTIASGPPDTACTDGKQVVADENVCSIYYTCEANRQTPTASYRWVQRSCNSQYFDVITNTCDGILEARPYPGCDRCEFKAKGDSIYFANAVDPNCNEYFTCKNGRKDNDDLRTCKSYQFFNEEFQSCDGRLYLQHEYVANNGACQDYSCNEERQCELVNAQTHV